MATPETPVSGDRPATHVRYFPGGAYLEFRAGARGGWASRAVNAQGAPDNWIYFGPELPSDAEPIAEQWRYQTHDGAIVWGPARESVDLATVMDRYAWVWLDEARRVRFSVGWITLRVAVHKLRHDEIMSAIVGGAA